MKDERKHQIRNALIQYKQDKGVSQKDIAKRCDLNESVISHIFNAKWAIGNSPIKDVDFIKIERMLGIGVCVVETQSFKSIMGCLVEAKQYSLPMILDGDTGSGKSEAVKEFCRRFPKSTYRINAAADFTAKRFIISVSEALGIPSGLDQYSLRGEIQVELAQQEKPILIIDEAENLKDGNYAAIKAIYDNLEDKLGIVLVGANEYWEGLLVKSKRFRRTGNCFPQIVSRFRANVHKVPVMSYEDAAAACEMYGITEPKKVRELFNRSEDYRALFGALKAIQRENELREELQYA
jgi:hypothetical protein